MKLEEITMLGNWNTEEELIKIIELIEDKISYKGYSEDEVITLVNKLLEINVLSLKYEAREELLNTLCNANSYYNIQEKVDFNNILAIKDELEDDLKEYILELFG
ncbi:hypothetical protein [Cellulosilyticum lentocellum]|uniref:Uncharacterized protein n=1 Tax=Cellulosilyticum lentocellum (strain ATCC 49066 / DSM 5427 / NCIMB 11756 / RHM5) TaxID=642492 RepID=F2JHT3_CELLD|nr:hypothetical protein [Cellulosilyticum lentocellum]ADZ85425.1 hypothetical protein Clole_3745 [Cellulosilyticum lentocellum DSM 5427]